MVDLILPDEKSKWYYICQVTDRIFIGSAMDAQEPDLLQENGITAILNVSRVEDNDMSRYKQPVVAEYRWIPLYDGPGNKKEEFLRAVNELADLVAKNHKVLVHCRMGISRSAAVLACYLQSTGVYSLKEAISKIKQARPIIRINQALMELIHEIIKGR